VREEKFEEAAKCHETAANLLAEARAKLEASLIEEHKTSLPFQETPKLLRSAHSLITLESLSLQQDYHRRQATVVRYTKGFQSRVRVRVHVLLLCHCINVACFQDETSRVRRIQIRL